MVTVHRARGFRFVIHSDDHEPAHVHVVGQGHEAKIQFARGAPISVMENFGLTFGELRHALEEVRGHRTKLLMEWDDIHGR